jgi:hypothetical protein
MSGIVRRLWPLWVVTMSESEAIRLAKAYAAAWAVPWLRVLTTAKIRTWWFFGVERYFFTVDAGNGRVQASIDAQRGTVRQFEYYPNDPRAFLLPFRAAYPTYDPVRSGWRQGNGEQYKYTWHSFYKGLSNEAKTEYRRKYPPPADVERCWQGFYEWIADPPATGGG